MNPFQPIRRKLLGAAANVVCGAGAALAAPPSAAAPVTGEDWEAVARHYDVATDFINLENAYFGIMARSVSDDFKRNIDHVNRYNSHFLRRQFDGDGIEKIRAQLAAHAGVGLNEIAITRGATESLQNLICNYRLLRRNDTVMYANLDYDYMQFAMNDLAQRHGATATVLQVPEPVARDSAIDFYDQAMRKHPRTKLLLLTHINHRTGFVLPVRDIVKLAKARGIDVIVDVAQSWGQLDFKLPDLGADFVGANLHKWVGAPLGLGFLYIRKERLADIGVERGNKDYPADDIRGRVLSGTIDVAAVMTIPAALKHHGAVGAADRARRLRELRDYWVHRVRDHAEVQILTPEEAGGYGAVTSFRLRGRTTFEANVALASRLMERHGIFTVARKGPAGGSCIRVTPALYTRTADLDRLVDAIRDIAGA